MKLIGQTNRSNDDKLVLARRLARPVAQVVRVPSTLMGVA